MLRLILPFLIVFAMFYVGINVYRKLTNREKLELSKTIIYSSICSLLSVGTLTAIVLLF